jgi:DNA polymerase III subunit gamma/tau
MSYQVLARKWRPRNFTELVGQEHVLRALINALDNDRLHHAFLFTGTRGVGKTTIARILAKSLNCETGVTSKPCGTCSACREIDEGRFVDLIEVDAASRTKVEDTRELLENVQYAPSRGRYKVYLIDEVHMLSTHSFNALLKTLEEPPPHVKFLLATTDPQRLPVTILSRCLQFNLKRLPQTSIQTYLDALLLREAIPFEPEAVQFIARSADGSMRDALSLLDQAIAYCGGKLSVADVRAMLGSIDHADVFTLLDALAQRDASLLFARVRAMQEHAPDAAGVLNEINSALHHIALAQQVPDAIDDTRDDRAQILGYAQTFSAEDVQLFYQIGVIGRRDLHLAPDPQSGFEMTLLRMLAFQPQDETARPPGARIPSAPAPTPRAAAAPVSHASAPPTPSPTPPGARPAELDWNRMVQELDITGLTKQLAANCILKAHTTDALTLELQGAHSKLLTDNTRERLQQALQAYCKQPVRVQIDIGRDPQAESPAQSQERQRQERQTAAQQSVAKDARVQSLLDTFNAKIDTDSVQPLD